jgi:ABC-type amino acid transport system permease subunit
LSYDWNFLRLKPYTTAFVSGTLTTIEITLVVILLGTMAGVLLGLAMTRPVPRAILYPLLLPPH